MNSYEESRCEDFYHSLKITFLLTAFIYCNIYLFIDYPIIYYCILILSIFMSRKIQSPEFISDILSTFDCVIIINLITIVMSVLFVQE